VIKVGNIMNFCREGTEGKPQHVSSALFMTYQRSGAKLGALSNQAASADGVATDSMLYRQHDFI